MNLSGDLRSEARPTSVRHAYFARFTQYFWDIFSLLDGGGDELFELRVGALFVDSINSGTGKTHTSDILTDCERAWDRESFVLCSESLAADDGRMRCSHITGSFAKRYYIIVNAKW
jgi:hypothetical protein